MFSYGFWGRMDFGHVSILYRLVTVSVPLRSQFDNLEVFLLTLHVAGTVMYKT